MDTAHVYQTECFQNKKLLTQTKPENEIHAYWYNIDTTQTKSKNEMHAYWC